MPPHHSNPTIDRVVQHAFQQRSWTHEWHDSAYIWATILCHLKADWIHVPLTHPDPSAAAAMIEKRVNECDH